METTKQDLRYLNAQKQVSKLKGFYIHFAVYVAVNLIIIFGNQYEGTSIFSMDNYWTAIFWGIGLAFHAMTVFMPNFIFGNHWEERKIREIMDRNKKK